MRKCRLASGGMTRRPTVSTVVAFAIAVAAFAAAVVAAVLIGSSRSDSGSTTTGTPTSLDNPSAASERAVQVALPSVVQIESPGKLGSGIVFDGREGAAHRRLMVRAVLRRDRERTRSRNHVRVGDDVAAASRATPSRRSRASSPVMDAW